MTWDAQMDRCSNHFLHRTIWLGWLCRLFLLWLRLGFVILSRMTLLCVTAFASVFLLLWEVVGALYNRADRGDYLMFVTHFHNVSPLNGPSFHPVVSQPQLASTQNKTSPPIPIIIIP